MLHSIYIQCHGFPVTGVANTFLLQYILLKYLFIKNYCTCSVNDYFDGKYLDTSKVK